MALRAVLVMLIAKAPNCLVIAPATEDPKNPVETKRMSSIIFFVDDIVSVSFPSRCSLVREPSGACTLGELSLLKTKAIPSFISPLERLNTVINEKATEYILKMKSSWRCGRERN